MILCPRTGRKPWTCLCPECVAQRTAVGGDVSPTPNRDVGWAAPRAVILSDRPVRIAGGAITRGLYFFSRWRRAPGGDILFGADGQPQREGGPGDGGLQCCVPEQSRSLLRGAMHVASVKPPTVVQLFRTANSEYFALRTYDGEYTFSRDTLDRALREMHDHAGDPGVGSLWDEETFSPFKDLFERHRMAGAPGQAHNLRSLGLLTQQPGTFPVDAAARGPRGSLHPQPAMASMMPALYDKRTAELEEWARNGEWGSQMPLENIVFNHETDPHLVARAHRYMWNTGLGRLEGDTLLYHCSADDRYLIRQYDPIDNRQRDVGANLAEILGYSVAPGALPIESSATLGCVHRVLENHVGQSIPPAELRAWSEVGADRVFCAWGTGVATLNGQAVAELGLQKTDRSPTMESPE